MKTLIVLAHPRRDSLTARVADIFVDGLDRAGHPVEFADLVAEGFDPVLRAPDEPDWDDPRKLYPEDVQREMARVERNDASLLVFPVYWWSVPAVLKGWIDRVWNHGWAYGDRSFPQRRVWMVGVAGTSAEGFAKRGYDRSISTQLETGLLDYCGVAERRFELLHGSIEDEACIAQILNDAERLAKEF